MMEVGLDGRSSQTYYIMSWAIKIEEEGSHGQVIS
jgi:hypothetical protein